MSVVGVMRVFMGMNDAIGMGVEVGVELIADGAADAPEKVHQPERDQKPAREVAAEPLDPLEFEHRNAKGNADQAQDD
jgi:hypothetical protein